MNKKLNVAAVLFESYELLDFYGPLQMFGMLADDFEIFQVSETIGSIQSSAGISGYAEYALSDERQYDIILVPGGYGTREQVKNTQLLNWLQQQVQGAKFITSVCTGALVLSAAGLLEGKRATTNKAEFKRVSATGEDVEWIPTARWVEDGRVLTSAGVSAGMDMALRLIELTVGTEKAESTASAAEYEWHNDASWDPFAKVFNLI